jgi:ubiquitin carboxyl-terminal hydrolase 4/11/15
VCASASLTPASGSPPFTPGSTYYLITKSFFQALTTYACSGEGSAPQPDFENLAQAGPVELWAPGRDGKATRQAFWKLRDGLGEDVDFMYTGAEGWDSLTALTGKSEPAFPRICMPSQIVEVSPNIYRLHVVTATPSIPVPPAAPPAPILFTLPRSSTVVQLREFLRTVLADRVGATAPFRVFSLDASEGPTGLEVEPKDLPGFGAKVLTGNNDTIEALGFADNDSLVVEIGNPKYTVDVDLATQKAVNIGGPAPLFAKPAFFSGTGNASDSSSSSNQLLSLANAKGPMMTRSQARGKSGGKGLVGLSNLGNTCFLASATQCLSNTHVLVDYFLSETHRYPSADPLADVYKEELNPDNPLGMHGQVAEAFGDTVQNLWESPSFSSYAPRRLKGTCARFAPQFAGYGQHDTQEFLAFLLDGLHEDLNRIKKKPYIEKPDWKAGGGDRELADLGRECWDGYKKRNDSVIVDLFQGQLQSTLVCPDCHKESITMDPFMYLTVPLPISQTRTVKIIFFPRDTEKSPINVHMLLPANASFATLKDKLGRLTGTQASNIVGFDLFKNAVYAWWMDIDPMTTMTDNDIGVFHEVGAPVTATGKGVGTLPTDESVTVPVYTFAPDDNPRSSYQRPGAIPESPCLEPFFITLSKTEATDPAAVREAIMRAYSRLVRPEKRSELWVLSNDPHAKVLVDDDESVAEIRIDSSPVSTQEATLAPPSEIPRTGSQVSLASQSPSQAAQSGRLVTRGDLFKVFVADASSSESSTSSFFSKKDPALNPLYRQTPSKAAGSWSGLEKRARAKRPFFKRVSSGIFGSSAANSEDEFEDSGVSACVRKGEGIFVQWKQDDFHEFFERDRDSLAKQLEDVIDPEIAKDKEKKKAGRAITLDDCLDEFSKQETLGQNDEWYCPVCKKHVQATKKLDIYKAPDILVICLKRFGSARNLRDKLDHLVQYPLEGLNLDERIGERRITQSLKLSDEEAKHYGIEHSTEPFIYDLYAVDNHFGGLGGGHYTAFCHNKVDDHWYNYDDSRVSKASPDAVKNNRAAYLLFYKRRTARRIGGISRIKAEEASRAATPMPSMPGSPNIGPSVPASAMASNMPSGPGSPNETSPVVSDDDSSDSDDNLALSGKRVAHPGVPFNPQAIGFGNTAWSSSAVQHSFGQGLPTPNGSDDGEEFIEVAVPAPSTSGESGLGENYAVVPSQTSESDAEMVSMPRSPQSPE